jgi:predicted HicB family RNase H-like nuclease
MAQPRGKIFTMIQFNFRKDLHAQLQALAKSDGVPIRDLVERAVTSYVKFRLSQNS